MTVLHRSSPSSSGQHSAESSPGSSRGRSGSRSETDLLATASSALRRLHFKSTASRRYKGKNLGANTVQQIPTVVIMGSSTTSETTINTSTDSATTQVTAVTATDGETTEDCGDGGARRGGPGPQPASHHIDDILGMGSLDRADEDVFVKDPRATELRETRGSQTSVVACGSTHGSGCGSGQLQSTPTTPLLSAYHRKSGDQSFIFTRTEIEDDGEDFLGDPCSPTMLMSHTSLSGRLPVTTRTPPNSPLVKQGGQQHYKRKHHVSRSRQAPDRRHSHHHPPPSPTLSVRAAADLRRMSDQPYSSAGKEFFLNGRDSSHDSDTDCRPSRRESVDNSKKNGPTTSHHRRSPNRRKSSCASVGGSPRKRGNVQHRKASATIVVQQPSVTGNSPEGAPGCSIGDDNQNRCIDANVMIVDKQQQRERNMRQLLDVTNQHAHDLEMRYGSPHHSRSQSVKTPGRSGNVSDRARPHLLCLPQQRARVASMPNTGVEEEYYRLRHFSITGKGIVNRGDSLKSRRSRSKNSVASSNSSHSVEDVDTLVAALDLAGTEHVGPGATSHPGSARSSASCSLASSRDSSTCTQPFRVVMLGAPGVGKSSIVQQFMTSEYLHAYDLSLDDECGEKSVSVLLDGEESELTFVDHPASDTTPVNVDSQPEPHAYCVVYSQADLSSFRKAEDELQRLWTRGCVGTKAVILVANKTDLVRSRVVTAEEGRAAATSFDCKFIETSVAINHNVDELLVGVLTQIRLKLQDPERSRSIFRKRSTSRSKSRSKSPLIVSCVGGLTSTCVGSEDSNGNPGPGSPSHPGPHLGRGRMSASLKVKGLLGKVWARDSKSKSCENLHVL